MSGFDLEIWFPSQEEVSVFMETTFSSDEGPEFGMLGFFSLFAARTAANLNGSPAQHGLGSALLGFRSGGNGYPAGLLAQSDVVLKSPTVRGGRKGFKATCRPNARKFFTYKPQGFGIMGKGTEFYAPMAVFAFAAYLYDRYGANPSFAGALRNVAEGIGGHTLSGQLGIINQHDIALRVFATSSAD